MTKYNSVVPGTLYDFETEACPQHSAYSHICAVRTLAELSSATATPAY